MLGKKLINPGGVACTTDTTQILDGDTTQSTALYRFEDNVNDTASSTGKFGKGAIFTSALTTRIDLSSNAAFAKSNDFSLSMWFYMDTMAANDNQTILAYNTNLTPRYFIMFNNGSGNIGNIRFYGGGSTNRYSANSLFSTGSWYHLAVSKSSTAGLVVYLNGTAVITQTGETAAYTNGSQANSKNCIGAYYAANSHLYQFKGKIDQFRVFNKPITQAEVNTLYAETSSTVNTLQILGDTSCIATYTLEGNADDLSNNYDATATSDVIYDYNGTLSGATYVTGKFGKAASFDGTNDYISAYNPNASGGARSFSAWIKTTSTAFQTIISNGGASHSRGLNMFVYNNKLYSTSGNGSGENYGPTSSASINTGEWVHCALTMSGTASGSILKAYVNGTLDGTHTTTVAITDTSDSFRIGGRYINGSYASAWFNGQIDQVRIFDKELSPGEINSLYNETTTTAALNTITNPSTIAYYKMADDTDETGSYNGTASTVDFNVEGKYGFASKFNGSSSYISFPSPYSHTSNEENITVSWWMNGDSVFSNGSFWAILGGEISNSSGNAGTININAYGKGTNQAYISLTRIWGSSARYHHSASTSSSDWVTMIPGQWYHNVITYDPVTNSSKYYVDNTLIYNITFSTYSTSGNATNGTLAWGKYRNGNSYFSGKIDQARFFNKVISADEVTKLYNEIQCANAITTPESYFNTKLYPGDGNTTQTITGVGFEAGFTWIKDRSVAESHALFDSVRGANQWLSSNTTAAQTTYSGNYGLLSWNSNGFQVGNGTAVNDSSENYVSWNWKAASSNTTNNDGTIASTVRASQESGFSIVNWSATTTVSDLVGHGLSAKPQIIIMKNASSASTNWFVFSDIFDGSYDFLYLNTTAAKANSSRNKPTATVFDQGNLGGVSAGNNCIAYCFHSVDGYQRIGSYVGNGSAYGTFVYTGFEPAWLMIKRTDAAGEWNIFDNKRDTENPRDVTLWAQDSATESTASQSGVYDVDFLTNGFQIKNTYNPFNNSSGTYLFMAIAANPDTTAPTKTSSFNTITWSGSGGATNITTVGFKPDLVWWKARNSSSYNWKAINSIRGASKNLYPNLTNAEATDVATTAFIDNGFSFGSGGNGNVSSLNFVGYAWKGLDHDRNLAAINNDGSITSIVSANPEAGFSIFRNIGTPSTSSTIGHGLSQAPDLVIQKAFAVTGDWYVLFKVDGTNWQYSKLNTTAAFLTPGTTFGLSSTTINNWGWNGYDMINYCWHSVAGHSKIGTYTGNASTTGPSITVGFRPSWVLIKKTSGTGSWYIFDAARAGSTTAFPKMLYVNLSNVEYDTTGTAYDGMVITTTATTFEVDFSSAWADLNASGSTYLYMAFK
tara:strand:+ start:5200 stop:9270 length:4071 start_codon:yes stop_codon:yes gene_type:complete